MKNNLFRQAFDSLRSQPLISSITIAGTALAIFLIMVSVMTYEMPVAPMAPESNRDRWLVEIGESIGNTKWGNSEDFCSNGALGYNTIREVFYQMEIPEAVSAFVSSPNVTSVSLPGAPTMAVDCREVDGNYWKVMDFTFINGGPFTQEQFESAVPLAVIDETISRQLFGTIDAAGKQIEVNYTPYTVSGVVRDVSSLASYGYAEVWIPFSTTGVIDFQWNGYMGGLSAIILARDKDDFPAIREEYKMLYDKLSDQASADGWVFYHRERPYEQKIQAISNGVNTTPDYSAEIRSRIIFFLILLIVPAVNLSSMTHSSLSRRSHEIGIRRAFGAPRHTIVLDLITQNLLITLFAGVIGWICAILFAWLGADIVFSTGYGRGAVTNISPFHLIHWSTFFWAMFFCFILNLLSAGIPAWNASRVNIINALSGKS